MSHPHPSTGGPGVSRPRLPTEDEIRAAAAELGLADEHGNYRQRDRARLAAAVQAARQGEAAATPGGSSTARQLGAFAGELAAAGVDATNTGPLLAEVGRYLLETQGLRLDSQGEEITPS
ncbi:hypothetical protein [Nocardia sp. NBC_01009]|uniref:hypothetical protein n=1 Tax=Nocardia sp. NBC_01009 TaxID=2975996 RepID=UPI00386A8ADD|nr:hypothetical protein OHA42_04945 [Nocardia sp. NBC_01009]